MQHVFCPVHSYIVSIKELLFRVLWTAFLPLLGVSSDRDNQCKWWRTFSQRFDYNVFSRSGRCLCSLPFHSFIHSNKHYWVLQIFCLIEIWRWRHNLFPHPPSSLLGYTHAINKQESEWTTYQAVISANETKNRVKGQRILGKMWAMVSWSWLVLALENYVYLPRTHI